MKENITIRTRRKDEGAMAVERIKEHEIVETDQTETSSPLLTYRHQRHGTNCALSGGVAEKNL
jgi:hypothetical protein